MPRRAGIWIRKGTDWYYTTINGKQIRLSKEKAEAEKIFHSLMANKEDDEEPQPSALLGPTFKKLADDYLVATQPDKCERAFQWQVTTLKSFCESLKRGTLAKDVKPYMADAWLLKRKTWGDGTKANARKVLKAVCNWAVEKGYLEESPLKKLKRKDGQARDRIMTPEELAAIYAFLEKRSRDFKDFLRAIELTGARPFSEMAKATAKSVDFAKGTLTLQQHKNRKKTGKPRTIFLVPELLEMLRVRAEKYPEGPLFRSRRGKPWYNGSARKWFSLIDEKLGIQAFPYAWRATYITNALINHVPVEVVAELVGNTPAIVWKHYSHVAKRPDALTAAAKKAVGVT